MAKVRLLMPGEAMVLSEGILAPPGSIMGGAVNNHVNNIIDGVYKPTPTYTIINSIRLLEKSIGHY